MNKSKQYFFVVVAMYDIFKLIENGQFSECGDIDIGNNKVNSESLYYITKEIK